MNKVLLAIGGAVILAMGIVAALGGNQSPVSADGDQSTTPVPAVTTTETVTVAPSVADSTPPAPEEDALCGPSSQIAFTPLEQETGSFVLKIAEHIEPNGSDTHVLFDGDEPPQQGDLNVFRLWRDFVPEHTFLQGTWWSLNCPSDEAAEHEAIEAARHAASVTPNPQRVFGLDGSIILELEPTGEDLSGGPNSGRDGPTLAQAKKWASAPWRACPGERNCLTFESNSIINVDVPDTFCVEGWDGKRNITMRHGYKGEAAGLTVRAGSAC